MRSRTHLQVGKTAVNPISPLLSALFFDLGIYNPTKVMGKQYFNIVVVDSAANFLQKGCF